MRLLVVCTANLCRSPMAEFLLRAQLNAAGEAGVSVSSAGTRAQTGTPMQSSSQKVLERRGIPVMDSWRTRRLSTAMISQADLVLTAASAHRDAVVSLEPAAARRTFLILELAALAERAGPIDPATGIAGVLQSASRARSHLVGGPPAEFDLPDPYGRSVRAFRRCADAVQLASERVVALLAQADY